MLSAADMMRILPGHTLLAYDHGQPFWMYYPSPGMVWGQSSNGDVDVGHWWTEKGRYCRAWRRWYDGAAQCWALATLGQDQLPGWITISIKGETLVQRGNTIGSAQPHFQLASLITDIDTNSVSPNSGIGPELRVDLADREAAQNVSDPSAAEEASAGGGSAGDTRDPSGSDEGGNDGSSSADSGGHASSTGGKTGGSSAAGSSGDEGGQSSGGSSASKSSGGKRSGSPSSPHQGGAEGASSGGSDEGGPGGSRKSREKPRQGP